MKSAPHPINTTALLAFFSVYIIWGSTYLAIRYAIATIPAWTLASTRYFAAAAILGLISYLKKENKLTKVEMQMAAVTGIFLVGANGLVCVVEYWVPSGIVAVVVGSMPIWILFLNWFSFGHIKPSLHKVVGALIGLVGVGLIASGGALPEKSSQYAKYGVLILCVATFSWSVGTLLQQRIAKGTSVFRYSGLQMFAGATVAGVISLIFERPWQIDPTSISTASIYAHLYLVVFGSVIAFTGYSWLSRNIEPHLVSTYALVNPVIAVGLGWFFFSEPITAKFVLATLLVIIGLSLLMLNWKKILK
jgi:drug/metabolite transporter (DMT)-like permease